MSDQEFYVRLKPFAPRQGYKTQRHSHREQIFVGGVRPNWYLVGETLAAELRAKRQLQNDPDSRPMFDVVDKATKAEIEEREQSSFLAGMGYNAATIGKPNDVIAPPTHDIRSAAERVAATTITSQQASGGGRNAAIPKPRRGRKSNNSGAIVSDDVQSDNVSEDVQSGGSNTDAVLDGATSESVDGSAGS